ncbi:hypothetical protein Hanom_Chr06g00512571 [Helianthus anomalus]
MTLQFRYFSNTSVFGLQKTLWLSQLKTISIRLISHELVCASPDEKGLATSRLECVAQPAIKTIHSKHDP